MNYTALVDEVSSKYNYSEDLKIAIRLTLPLMVNRYGQSHIDEICDLFRNVRIFATGDMSEANRQNMEIEMLNGANNHLVIDDGENPYQSESDPGSYYSYQAIYDEEMNVVGEARWIAVKDMQDSLNGEQYKNLFGTTVNMPYFIHEVNHAFAMQNSTYRKEDNKIFAKHGMFEEEYSFVSKDGKIELKKEMSNNIIVEEAINEKFSQDMLVELMQVSDYGEISTMLRDINHVSTSYSPLLISLADKLENQLGKEEMLNWRKYNDKSVLQELNEKASQSDIAKKYCNGQNPYDYFDQKCFGIFLLKSNGYKMPIEDYARRSKELMVAAFAPLCAYQDVKHGTMSVEKFDSIRSGILGIEMSNEKKEVIEESPKSK